jgi:hypothetical protein
MNKIVNYHLSKSRALAPRDGHNCGGPSTMADDHGMHDSVAYGASVKWRA